MRKYITIFKANWQATFEYRLNFFLGRLENIILLVTLYFLWNSIFAQQETIFDYNKAQILTYVIGGHFLRALILETRTKFVGEEIYSGFISSVLLKPVSYFWQWFAEDFARKALTILTSIFEAAIFIVLVKPSLFIQKDINLILLTIVAIVLAAFLNFVITFTTALFGFWSDETYGPSFLMDVIINFASGAFFPLDVLPQFLALSLKVLPFSYLLFFPLKIYLGQLSFGAVFTGLGLQVLWLFILSNIYRFVWSRGLRRYSTYGG
ncbi:MAG: ABC-2 family transporter protein [Candidatus Cloacimonetes bacterium]|nr:ABC-2 family transporter protein [Candidatus Cloacimonadota bacterium]